MTSFEKLVEALRSPDLTRGERGLLFGQLLNSTGGSWAEGADDDSTFAEFAYGTAQHQVRGQRYKASDGRLDARDIGQIVLLRLLDSLPKITIPVEQWVVAATKFEIRRALKSAGPMRSARSMETDHERGIDYETPPTAEPWTPEEVAAADHVAKRVAEAVGRLTPALRVVASAKLFQDPGMTLVQLGARLQITPDCARQRWRRARLQIKAQLDDIDVAVFMRERRVVAP
jgi:RNA polymerase sigma factor (sigma-70 family)